MDKEQELRGDAKLVWDAVERHIEASAVDGISAGGEFSRDVQVGQQKYVDGLRVGRLAAINAIRRSSSDEQAEVVGWQPIETAPKDGTSIDLWVTEKFRAYRVPDAWWGDEEIWTTGRGSSVEGFFDSATGVPLIRAVYWRPLPTPPIQGDGK